jgi:hypothetical protein
LCRTVTDKIFARLKEFLLVSVIFIIAREWSDEMNLKVANLVGVQFGIFVGIMSWLAYSQLPFGEPRTAAEVQEARVGPVTTFAPASNPGDQRSQTVDYRADQERNQPVAEQPAPSVHQYSAEAVQQYSALAAQQYYQQIAPRRYASSGLENRSIVADAPSYAEVEQEPAVVQDYPAPQTVAYVQPTQFIVYPQPQFVVFSNRHRFANRCRPAPPVIGAHMATAHRRPDRGGSHLSGSTEFESPASPSAALRRPTKSLGAVHRRNDSVPSCQPTQGFGPRGKR